MVWDKEVLSPEEARASLPRYRFDKTTLENDVTAKVRAILAARLAGAATQTPPAAAGGGSGSSSGGGLTT